MASWSAGFAVAAEIAVLVINLVLDRFVDVLRASNLHRFSRSLGWFGSIDAEVRDFEVLDLEDPPPLGSVQADVAATIDLKLRFLFFFRFSGPMVFRVDNVDVALSRTPGGLPRGVVLSITPGLAVDIDFPGSRGIMGWLLRRVVGPLVAMGVWLAFRIIRRVEVPVWELVDVFNVLGIRFAQGSPFLTAQKAVAPNSLLLASDFDVAGGRQGNRAALQSFIPAGCNVAAVIDERVLTAAVQVAYSKGWVPTQFKVSGWKISIRSIGFAFEPDTIVATGQLGARRKSCWCRVKAKITYRVEVMPAVATSGTPQPRIDFRYKADVNAHVSTSGMLVVLGMLMFPGMFLALTMASAFLVNVVLNQFLPFTTSFQQSGLQMTVTASSVHFSGFIPLSMTFPLQLAGQGSYDLTRFQSFQLPGNAQIKAGFTKDSLAIQKDEIRLAVELS